jgi:SOS response regulatory protein OraA/RecX
VAAEDAFESAARLLRHRDRAVADLDRRLAERGFGDEDRAAAIATLTRTGVVDDGRFAANRARALASRGAGDRLIRHDLEAAGVDAEAIAAALSEVEPESERVAGIVERRGMGPNTARYLAGKGFSEDAIRAAVARAAKDGLG